MMVNEPSTSNRFIRLRRDKNSQTEHRLVCCNLQTRSMRLALLATVLFVSLSSCMNNPPVQNSESTESWQEEFDLANRELSHTGEATYFNLTPGFQITLESSSETLVISVMDETREIGGITTRVVEEREHKNGELYEISRNFYAIDLKTGDVFYFGEEVDFYTQGQITGHSGAWFAHEDGNRPGLIMPGTPRVGMKYYQELAPEVAMDRARVISINETFATAVGEFENCLLTQESSLLNPIAIEYKTYCPGIGLVQDQTLLLTGYGYE